MPHCSVAHRQQAAYSTQLKDVGWNLLCESDNHIVGIVKIQDISN